MLGIRLVLLLLVGAVCAGIGLLGTSREHGLAAPAAIGIGAGLVAASAVRAMGLPLILPVSIGALVCPAVWAVVGAALIVGALRLIFGAGGRAEAR